VTIRGCTGEHAKRTMSHPPSLEAKEFIMQTASAAHMNLAALYQWLPQVERRQSPTVYIVEPEAPTREAVAALVQRAGWRAVTAATAEEHLDRPRVVAASCLVVDQHLPGMSGVELQELVANRTETPVIVTSGSADVRTTVRAMKAGAFEFLMKPVSEEALLLSIGLAIERSSVEVLQVTRVREIERRYDELTRRERDVLRLVVTGRMNKQVGFELGISEITVKVHRGSVMRKMRAKSLVELAGMTANLRAMGCVADHVGADAFGDRRATDQACGTLEMRRCSARC
jgi:FixJ family two-component response regulator